MIRLQVNNLGKAFRTYASEWHRVAGWFGWPIRPTGEQWVLRGIGFSLAAGEAVGIVGKNGAGKSTLLKMITGTLKASEGSIAVNGRVAAILELGMGFNPELTGGENVRHAAGLMGLSREEIERLLPEIREFAEIGSYFDEPVRTYSSGMQARIAFAVATAHRPDILIVDEALSVGDPYFQAKCYERISRYRREGMTLLLVTHAVEEIVRQCDRAILLKDGALLLDGPPREITNHYLDHLFGSGRPPRPVKDEAAARPKHHELPAGAEERFGERPGYRKEEHRWGDGGAVILDYLITAGGTAYPPMIESNSLTEFCFKVRFERDFAQVFPGLLLKTLDGVFIYGTNSFLASQGREQPAAEAGEIRVYRFAMPLALNQGHYLVSFGISSGEKIEALVPLERRYDSVIINVTSSAPFWGVADLNATFTTGE